MIASQITRATFRRAVTDTLRSCRRQLEEAERAGSAYFLIRDLSAAVDALELIESEMRSGTQRPKGRRSAMFTRYVIDEEERMVMDAELKNATVRIEDLYARS